MFGNVCEEVSLPDLFVQASQLLEANKIFLIFDELSQKKLTIFLIVRIKLMKVFWTSRAWPWQYKVFNYVLKSRF